jgi:hypothetical protein
VMNIAGKARSSCRESGGKTLSRRFEVGEASLVHGPCTHVTHEIGVERGRAC